MENHQNLSPLPTYLSSFYSCIYFLWVFHKREAMCYFNLCVCLNSLNITFLDCIHLPRNSSSLSSFMAGEYCVIYKYHIFLTHSSVAGYMLFPRLSFYKLCCHNTDMHTSLYNDTGMIPRKGIAGWNGICFSFFWGISTLFSAYKFGLLCWCSWVLF